MIESVVNRSTLDAMLVVLTREARDEPGGVLCGHALSSTEVTSVRRLGTSLFRGGTSPLAYKGA